MGAGGHEEAVLVTVFVCGGIFIRAGRFTSVVAARIRAKLSTSAFCSPYVQLVRLFFQRPTEPFLQDEILVWCGSAARSQVMNVVAAGGYVRCARQDLYGNVLPWGWRAKRRWAKGSADLTETWGYLVHPIRPSDERLWQRIRRDRHVEFFPHQSRGSCGGARSSRKEW